MVEFFDPVAQQEISFHIDAKLKTKWDTLREGKLADLNEDRVYLVDGRERTGKSSFAFQQAKYLDPTFTVERICFKPEDFLHQIRTAPKGSVVVFDEAFRGLSSKSSRSTTNRAIVQALMEVGQRNLIIFVVLPTIFLLEIYAAVFRSECLFHIYRSKRRKENDKRPRAFRIYNYTKKKHLYLRGRAKFFSYAKPRIKMAKGRFLVKKNALWKTGIPYETFDMNAYIAKKDEAFREGADKKEDLESAYKTERDLIIKMIYKTYIPSHRKISDWFFTGGVRLSHAQIGRILGGIAENAEDGTGNVA